jgi:hypothetical protein
VALAAAAAVIITAVSCCGRHRLRPARWAAHALRTDDAVI